METYNRRRLSDFGIGDKFVQDNWSKSNATGTIRGLHYQSPPYEQAKLVSVLRGAIFDVAVDIRIGSPTFGQWKGYELSAENRNQFYIPAGFAHGFVTLQPDSEVCYKCSDFYNPAAEGGIRWNDPSINIDWPLDCTPVLSEKDSAAPFLEDFESPFFWKQEE